MSEQRQFNFPLFLGILFTVLFLLLHFFIIVYYLNTQINHQQKSTYNKAAYAFIKMIEVTRTTIGQQQTNEYLNLLSKAQLKLNNKSIILSLSQHPLYSQHFINSQVDTIKQYFNNSNGTINFSMQLSNKTWLNYDSGSSHNFYIDISLFLLLELIFMALIIFYIWTSWRFIDPLKKFKRLADKLGVDVNADPVPSLGPQIVREAVKALNMMQLRIQSLLDSRTKMLASISHDLRTPITRLKLRLQLMPETEHTQLVLNDLTGMESMISSVLNFAKNDASHEKKVRLDFSSLLQSICYDFDDTGNNVTFHPIDCKIVMEGRIQALKRALTNLIENAIKYGKTATVRQNLLSEKKFQIFIEDEGPGIADDELSKVMEAYYRSKHCHSETIGSGLGLTIAHEIITTHAGTLILENREQTGLRVIINLPYEEIE